MVGELEDQPDFTEALGAMVAASLLVPLPAAALTLLLGPLGILFLGPAVLMVGMLVSLGHGLLIGLPAYLLLRRLVRPNLPISCAAGAVVGCVPVSVILVADTSQEGVTWPIIVGAAAVFGGIGGAAFWRQLMRHR